MLRFWWRAVKWAWTNRKYFKFSSPAGAILLIAVDLFLDWRGLLPEFLGRYQGDVLQKLLTTAAVGMGGALLGCSIEILFLMLKAPSVLLEEAEQRNRSCEDLIAELKSHTQHLQSTNTTLCSQVQTSISRREGVQKLLEDHVQKVLSNLQPDILNDVRKLVLSVESGIPKHTFPDRHWAPLEGLRDHGLIGKTDEYAARFYVTETYRDLVIEYFGQQQPPAQA